MIRKNRHITADDYHSFKLQACQQLGIRLVFVDEDDWIADNVGIESMIEEEVLSICTSSSNYRYSYYHE